MTSNIRSLEVQKKEMETIFQLFGDVKTLDPSVENEASTLLNDFNIDGLRRLKAKLKRKQK